MQRLVLIFGAITTSYSLDVRAEIREFGAHTELGKPHHHHDRNSQELANHDSGLEMNANAPRVSDGAAVAGPGVSDVDGDGVTNSFDVCDNTTAGAVVDAEGRPLGDIDGDCDSDLADLALFQQGLTGPIPGSNFGLCNPLTDPTGCANDMNCYVIPSNANFTACANATDNGTQEDPCQFLNACADGYSCVLLDNQAAPVGNVCAFICDPSNTGGPTCADGPGPPYQCAPINGFYSSLPDFPVEIGMCIDPGEWTLFDADGDGVLVFIDLCPDTPPGDTVDSTGCTVPMGACCITPNSCCVDDTTQAACEGVGGLYLGDDSVCNLNCNR